MKKMMAVLLCLCMAVSLAAPAFATEGADTAVLAEVLAAVELAEEADVLLTEEDTGVPADTPVDDGSGDETAKDREDSTDEGGDEGGSGTQDPDGSNDGDSGVGYTPLAEGDVTDTIVWDLSKDFVLTITGTGEMPDYDAIGKTPWADYFEKITAINFFGEITRIGANSFAYCSAVMEVKLPETLVSIGNSAFRGLEKLEAIAFPASLKTVEKFAFAHNNLRAIDLPDGIETLGDSAFNPSAAITEITLPGSLTSMGEGVFAVCNALKTITVGEGIKALGTCFINCYGVTTLNLPSTIETLDHNFIAGLGDTAALKTITVAEGEDTSISFYMWKDEAGNCYTTGDLLMGAAYEGDLTALWQTGGKLTDTIEWSLDTEGYLTISGTGAMPDFTTAADGSPAPWSQLRSDFAVKYVVVMDGITAVGDYAFYYCPKMESIALPATIESLGKECLNLTALNAIEVAPNSDGSAFWGFKDEDGEDLTVAELLSSTGYAGNLTPVWYGFSDVAASDWFYDYVMYCYDEGIMNGVGEGLFDPYGGATRAQVVTVLYRLAGEPTGAAASSFSDVPEGQWFTEAVNWAAEAGIAKGYEDGTFDPYRYVTREEFLVFLNRFTVTSIWERQLNEWSELYDLSACGVSDAENISDWALEAETWSYIIGLQTGYDNGDETYSLCPRSTITRAELATFLSRYASNLVLYTYAESCQYMVGYAPSVAVTAFKTEPDEKIEIDEDLEAWCFYDKGVALLVDFSTSSKGVIADWTYTGIL